MASSSHGSGKVSKYNILTVIMKRMIVPLSLVDSLLNTPNCLICAAFNMRLGRSHKSLLSPVLYITENRNTCTETPTVIGENERSHSTPPVTFRTWTVKGIPKRFESSTIINSGKIRKRSHPHARTQQIVASILGRVTTKEDPPYLHYVPVGLVGLAR